MPETTQWKLPKGVSVVEDPWTLPKGVSVVPPSDAVPVDDPLPALSPEARERAESITVDDLKPKGPGFSDFAMPWLPTIKKQLAKHGLGVGDIANPLLAAAGSKFDDAPNDEESMSRRQAEWNETVKPFVKLADWGGYNPIPGNMQQTTGAWQAATDIAAPAMRLFGFTDAADDMHMLGDAIEQAAVAMEEGGVVPDWFEEGARGVTRSATPMMLTGATGGGVPAVIGTAGIIEGDSSYTEARAAGLSNKDAYRYALDQGYWEALPAAAFSSVGLGGVEKMFAKLGVKGKPAMEAATTLKEAMKDAAKKFGIAALQEIPEENITELGHLVIRDVSKVDPEAFTNADGTYNWDSIYETANKTTRQTLMQVLAMSGGNIRGIDTSEANKNKQAFAQVEGLEEKVKGGGQVSRNDAKAWKRVTGETLSPKQSERTAYIRGLIEEAEAPAMLPVGVPAVGDLDAEPQIGDLDAPDMTTAGGIELTQGEPNAETIRRAEPAVEESAAPEVDEEMAALLAEREKAKETLSDADSTSESPQAPTTPPVSPQEPSATKQRVRDKIQELDSRPGGGTYIADLREAFPEMSHKELDAILLGMSRAGEAGVYANNDGGLDERTKKSALLTPSGRPRHIVKLPDSPPPTKATPKGARVATKEGKQRLEDAQQRMRDIVASKELKGKERADAISNARNLVQFYETNADTRKPLDTGYFQGDEVAYTGVVDDGFREFIYLEGHKAGQHGVAPTVEQKESGIRKRQDERREEQAGFRRLREAEAAATPKAPEAKKAKRGQKSEPATWKKNVSTGDSTTQYRGEQIIRLEGGGFYKVRMDISREIFKTLQQARAAIDKFTDRASAQASHRRAAMDLRLEAQAKAAKHAADTKGWEVGDNYIKFPKAPPASMRDRLKSVGFTYNPERQMWESPGTYDAKAFLHEHKYGTIYSEEAAPQSTPEKAPEAKASEDRAAFSFDEDDNPQSLRQVLDELDRGNPEGYEKAVGSPLSEFALGLKSPENAAVAELEPGQLTQLAESLINPLQEQLFDVVGENIGGMSDKSAAMLAESLQSQEDVPDGALDDTISRHGKQDGYREFIQNYGLPIPLMRALRDAATQIKGDKSFERLHDAIIGKPGEYHSDKVSKPKRGTKAVPPTQSTPEKAPAATPKVKEESTQTTQSASAKPSESVDRPDVTIGEKSGPHKDIVRRTLQREQDKGKPAWSDGTYVYTKSGKYEIRPDGKGRTSLHKLHEISEEGMLRWFEESEYLSFNRSMKETHDKFTSEEQRKADEHAKKEAEREEKEAADRLRTNNAHQKVSEEAAKIPKRRVDVQITKGGDTRETVKGVKVGEHLAVTKTEAKNNPWVITHLPSGMSLPGNHGTRQQAIETAWLLEQGLDWSKKKPQKKVVSEAQKRLAWFRHNEGDAPEFLQPSKPDSKSAKKPTAREAAKQKAKDALRKALGDGGLQFAGKPRTRKQKMNDVLDFVEAVKDYGIETFKEYVEFVAEVIGAKRTLEDAEFLESGWRVSGHDDTGSVEDVLKELQPEAPPVQPKAEEGKGPTGDTTGTKNVKTDELREEAGLGDRVMPEPQTQEEWDEEAARLTAADPGLPKRLAEQLKVSPEDVNYPPKIVEAVMGRYMVDLRNRLRAGEDVFDELRTAVEADERLGTEWSRQGTSRQMEREADFSLTGLMRKHIKKVGESPSDEVIKKLAEQAEEIERLREVVQEKDKAAVEAELARQVEKARADAAEAKAGKPTEKKGTKRERLSRRAKESVDTFKDAWKAAVKAGATSITTSGGLNPEATAALGKLAKAAAEVVKAYSALNINSFIEFMSKVKTDLGDITAEQENIFKQEWEKERGSDESPMGDAPTPAAIGVRAKQLLRAAVETGILEYEAVVQAVHEQLKREGVEQSEWATKTAITDYGDFTPLPPGETNEHIRRLKGEIRRTQQIEDAQNAIVRAKELLDGGKSPESVAAYLRDNNLLPKSTGRERATPQSIERDLISQLNELKKELPVSAEAKAGQLKTAISTAKTAAKNQLEVLDNEIKALEEAIKNKTRLAKPQDRVAPPTDSELSDLRVQLIEKRHEKKNRKAEYERIFPPTKKQRIRTAEQQERNAQRQIDKLEQELKDIKQGKEKGRTRQPDLRSNEIKAKLLRWRTRLKAARKAAKEAELGQWENEGGGLASNEQREDAIWLAHRKKSLERQLAFWQQREADAKAGKLPKDTKRRKRPEDQASLDSRMAVDKQKQRTIAFIEAEQRKRWNTGQWVAAVGEEMASAMTSIVAGLEASFALRQGAFYLGHPVRAARSLAAAAQSAFVERIAYSQEEDIFKRPNARNGEYKASEIQFTREGGPISDLEELTRSGFMRWLAKTESKWLLLPRIPAKGYMAADRAFRTYNNRMRADLYDTQKAHTMWARDFFHKHFDAKPAAWTDEDIKAVGRTSNILSGRGTGLKGSAWTRFVFWAPRWVWSRVQAGFILPIQLMTPKQATQFSNDPALRLVHAEMYTRAAVAAIAHASAIYFYMLMMADDDDETPDEPTVELTDLTSTDFGKVAVGDTRHDVLGGMQQPYVFISRVIRAAHASLSGSEETGPYARDAFDLGVQQLRYKFSVPMGAATDFLTGETAVGEELPDGFADRAIAVAKERWYPMAYGDMKEAVQNLGFKQGAVSAALAFFGDSVNTYGDRTEYREGNTGERQEQFEKDLERMTWEGEPLGYSDLLTDKQQRMVEARVKERKGKLLRDVTIDPKEKVKESTLKERERTKERFEEMKKTMTHAEAQGFLRAHYYRPKLDDDGNPKKDAKGNILRHYPETTSGLWAKRRKLAELYGEDWDEFKETPEGKALVK